MAKHLTSQKYIYKIHSSRIRNSNWNFNLTLEEAMKNNELISLADSTALRFIMNIKGINSNELEEMATTSKKIISKLKSKSYSKENSEKIKSEYIKLYNILHIPDFVNIIMDNNKDFDRLNLKKGFYINGIKFKRLLATPGGAKNSTVAYVSETVFDELTKKLDNGRNIEKEFIPAKLEAYKSLICSSSVPVPDPKGVLVVHDCLTKFKSEAIRIDDSKDGEPSVDHMFDYELELNESDGYGLIHPDLSNRWAKMFNQGTSSGFCIRNSFTKGMVFTFDYEMFAKLIAEEKYFVTDAWGNSIDIRKVQIVLTTSMLKLWDSYKDIVHYLKCCEENGYTFSVTKVLPERVENERNLNYQFIQSLDLSDSDIEELVAPTVNEIKDVLGGDWRKSLLFLKGVHLKENSFNNSDPDFTKALMIDKKMIHDPFVKEKIHNAIKKSINDAKVGVLKVRGNFSCVSGDPFSLCQSIFKLDVTGLLKSGEFYSKYWLDKGVDKVACFRAPMTCHNNIRILRMKKYIEGAQEKFDPDYWYRHMPTVTVFNSWDSTAESLNGLDKDGDHVLTTDNDVIIRSVRELPSIICNQKTGDKIIPKENDFIRANKNSFGDAIGSITNKITACFDLLPLFDKDSEEYKTIHYRIMCGQNYQQNAIDKSKGIVSESMPREWYDYRYLDNVSTDNTKKLYRNILIDKKPYFFIYIYPHLMKQYKKFKKNAEENCFIKFRVSLEELISKKDRTDDENLFLKYYYQTCPVFLTESTMNRICLKIEEEFKVNSIKFANQEFDYSILKTDKAYDESVFYDIHELYLDYTRKTREFAARRKFEKIDRDEKIENRKMFITKFIKDANEKCNNVEELTNIILDICYTNKNSKQFAWDICGDQIIKNLLHKNSNAVQFPQHDKYGDIVYGGERYLMRTQYVEEDGF